MDHIKKFLRKLTPKLQASVRSAIISIQNNDLKGLDIIPMAGKKNWFRCRVGTVRIIFIRIAPSVHSIHKVQFRGKAYSKG